jgi:hypothetical protein
MMRGWPNRPLARAEDAPGYREGDSYVRPGIWERECLGCAGGSTTPIRLLDAGWLRRAYHDEGLPAAQIAKQLGCSQSAVGRWLDRHGIPKRTHAEMVELREATPADRRGRKRNRQMVSGRGNTGPGAILHS